MQTQRGFTLLELILTLTIMGILFASSAPLVSSSLQAYLTAREMNADLVEVNIALERISREVRGASAVDSGSNATQIGFIRSDSTEACFKVSANRVYRYTNTGCSANETPLTGAVLATGSTPFNYSTITGNCASLTSTAGAETAHIVTITLDGANTGAPFRTSVYVRTDANPCFN